MSNGYALCDHLTSETARSGSLCGLCDTIHCGRPECRKEHEHAPRCPSCGSRDPGERWCTGHKTAPKPTATCCSCSDPWHGATSDPIQRAARVNAEMAAAIRDTALEDAAVLCDRVAGELNQLGADSQDAPRFAVSCLGKSIKVREIAHAIRQMKEKP